MTCDQALFFSQQEKIGGSALQKNNSDWSDARVKVWPRNTGNTSHKIFRDWPLNSHVYQNNTASKLLVSEKMCLLYWRFLINDLKDSSFLEL